ncbi:MAG TPA: copper chaperone PCu(A)C [Hyphomicrobiaceae bacterium]|nr:copper chaperone PCu(A)C [Hyphomicrobiaceae bacterium]
MNERSRRRPRCWNLPSRLGGTILAAAMLLIVVGAARAHEFSSKGVTVVHPWARATPGGVTVGGAYFEVRAAPGQGDRLIGGRSAIAGSLEVHSHSIENGIAKMRKIDGLPIKGGQSVVLKPGGYHVMLLDLKQPLKEGDLFKFTLTFEKAGDLEVEASVEPIGAKAPHGFDSHPTSTEKGSASGHHKH